jgi:hypothetical protein
MYNLVILGDSHANILKQSNVSSFFNLVGLHHVDAEHCARTCQFMPFLMHSVGLRGEMILKHYMEHYTNANIDYMMFVLGEPDIRIHFDKQINTLGRNIDEVIGLLVDNYIHKLIEIVPKNTKIIIKYCLPQRENSMFNVANNAYIPRGSLQQRVDWTKQLNNTLKAKCIDKGLLFFENIAYNDLTKETGELKDEYCDGITHYNVNSIGLINYEIEYFCKQNNILQ